MSLFLNDLPFCFFREIFLFYDKPFWNKNLELIHMVWLPQDSNFQLDKFIHRNSNSRVWTEDICKIEVVSSYPNALCLWIAGSEFFERLEDTTVSSECTELLRRFLDDESIPYPTAMSRWNRKVHIQNFISKYSYNNYYKCVLIGPNGTRIDFLEARIPIYRWEGIRWILSDWLNQYHLPR